MVKSRAEIQKAYRERLKAKDADGYLKKERERRKLNYVSSHDLSSVARVKRNLKQNEALKKHRKRKRKEAELESNVDNNNKERADEMREYLNVPQSGPAQLVVQMPFANTGRRSGPRKRISRALSKQAREYKKLKENLNTLQTKYKTTQRRLQRLQKKTTPKSPNTPRSKVQAQLREAGVNREQGKRVRKQLLMSHVLTEEIKAAKEGNNLDKQRILRTVIAGKIVRKYRCANIVSKSTGLCRNRIGKVDGKSINFNKVKRVREVRRYKNDVIAFLERDDNSRSLPGKADKIKTGTTTTQKRTLTDYLKNLHCKFLSENPAVKLSLASFCRIRPKYILPTSFISRNSCLCTKHQNMALILKAIRRIDVDVPSNPETFIKDPSVDKIDQAITNQNMQYDEWRRIAIEEKGKKKMIMRIVQVSTSKDDFINHLRHQTSDFIDHVSRMRTQYEQIRLLKDKLPVHHAVVHMDFAENYNCKSVEEIQSAYWNQTSVTLHPTVVYTKNEGEDIRHQSLVLVSDELSHNATTVVTFVKHIVETVKSVDPDVKMIHYWTDSPTSQYRNKTIFSMVANHEDIFDIKARWNFFEAGHGKGPCDGLGGTTKRMADLAMKSGRAVIQDAKDFYAWTKSENCSMSNVKFSFVSKESCEQTGNQLKNSVVKPIKGTMKVHAVVGLGSDVLCVRDVSCYCEECLEWNLCSSWKIETTASQRKCNELDTNLTDVIMDVDANAQTMATSSDNVNDNHNGDDQTNFRIDDFVVALYDGKLYAGQIVDHDPEDDQFVYHISFMERKKDMFQWPKNDDLLWCGRGDICFKINKPNPSGKSGRMFVISDEDLEKLENF